MPPLAKSFISVVPTGCDQLTDEYRLPPGRLLEAVNVKQKVTGIFSKRNGDTTKTTLSTIGSLPNGRSLSSTGDTLVLRTSEGLYFDSAALGEWVRKADVAPVATPPAPQVMPYGYRPTSCNSPDGKLRYYFAGDIGQNSTGQASLLQVGNGNTITGSNRASYWYFRVVDTTSGTEIVAPTSLATVVGWQGKAVAAGGFVWFFVGAASSRYIYVYKFDPTHPTTAPSLTTYYDAGGGAVIEGWDVYVNNLGNACVVVTGAALAKQGGGTAVAVASVLNPSTGLPTGLGSVGLAITGPAAECCVQWLQDENTNPTQLYFLMVGGSGMTVKVTTLNASSMALVSNVALAGTGTNFTVCTGYVQAGGNFITYYSEPFNPDPETDSLFQFQHNSSGTLVGGWSSPLYARSICSSVFRLSGGTSWYLIAVHDDDLAHLQQAYYLIDASTGKIIGRSLYGAGGDATQRATYTSGNTNAAWVAPVVVDTTTVYATLNAWTGSQYVAREIQFAIDDSAPGAWRRLGPMVRAADGQETVVPGGWPQHASGTSVSEFVPMYPRNAPLLAAVSSSAPIPPGAYTAQYLYSRIDALGNRSLSRPSPAANVTITLTPDTDPLTFVSVAIPGNDLGAIAAATTVALPACTAAGSGVGKTLTANANGALAVDGTSPTLGAQVLVKNQANPVDNGLYVVTATGDGSHPWVLTRATSYDQAADLAAVKIAFIQGGTTNSNTSWTVVSQYAMQWTVNTMRVTNSNPGDWQIEFYLTAGSGTTPYLQFTIPNDPTVTSIQVQTTQSAIFNDETLYTYAGGELPNDSPPPFGCACSWSRRVFLADTDEIGDVWVSKPKVTGRSVEFSADLTFNIPDGNGRIRAMGAIDDTQMAIFKSDGIWVIADNGGGPDNARGANMYQPVRLPGTFGCTNPQSLCTTARGLIFQASNSSGGDSTIADGGIYMITLDRRIIYIGQGVESFRGQPIASALFVPEQAQARLYLDAIPPSLGASSQAPSQNYRHPLDNNTIGLWRLTEQEEKQLRLLDIGPGSRWLAHDLGSADASIAQSTVARNLLGRARHFNGNAVCGGLAAGDATMLAAHQASWTWEGWLNPAFTGSTQFIIYRYGAIGGTSSSVNNLQVVIRVDPTTGAITIAHQHGSGTSETLVQSTGPFLVTNAWQHLAITKSVSGGNATYAIYVNGMLAQTFAAVPNCDGGSASYINLGCWPDPLITGTSFIGDMKDIRISTVVRSPSDIASDAGNGSQQHTLDANTLTLWRLDEDADCVDSSATGYHLTRKIHDVTQVADDDFTNQDVGGCGGRFFNGVTDFGGYAGHPSQETLRAGFEGSFTFEAWVNPSTLVMVPVLAPTCGLFAYGQEATSASTATNALTAKVKNTGAITVVAYHGAGVSASYTTTATPFAGQLRNSVHVAITKYLDGNGNAVFEFYVNGVLIETSTPITNYQSQAGASVFFRLGYGDDLGGGGIGAGRSWRGKMYDVRLSSIRRSAAEIAADYARGTPCATTQVQTSVSYFCLVYDMKTPVPSPINEAEQMGSWYQWTQPGAPRGSVFHKGIAHWMDQSGTVRYETQGKFYDDANTQILTRIHYAPISVAGSGGIQLLNRLLVANQWIGSCALKVTVYAAESDLNVPLSWVDSSIIMTDASREDFEVRNVPPRCTSVEIILEETASAYLTEGLRHRSIGLDVSLDPGKGRRLNTSQQA